MALFNLQCECGTSKRVFSDSFEIVNLQQKMCQCGKIMQRAVKGPSTQMIERLDNGSMVKALERYSDAERIFQERHDNADSLAGTKGNRS